MGERLFQANDLNHDGKFLVKTSHSTSTGQYPATNRPITPTRFVSYDEWEKWFERNPLRNDKDTDIRNRQPRRIDKSNQKRTVIANTLI